MDQGALQFFLSKTANWVYNLPYNTSHDLETWFACETKQCSTIPHIASIMQVHADCEGCVYASFGTI
jgi:hypothetical protein